MVDFKPFHPLTVFEEGRYANTKHKAKPVDNLAFAVFGHVTPDRFGIGAALAVKLKGVREHVTG